MVLCHFLETNRDEYNLLDKNVIELGAGTGLVSIVSSLLGIRKQNNPVFDQIFLSLLLFLYLISCNTQLHRLSPGAKVTSTDMPALLGNLQYNVMRNTKGLCKYIPLVGFSDFILSGW